MANDLLTFDWSELSGQTGDLQAWGPIADFCSKFPQHPVCDVQGRGNNPNDNGPLGGDLNRGHHPGDGPDDGGNLGWYPFS
jgi:hypothetical protein